MIDPGKDIVYVTVQPNTKRFMWEGQVQVRRLIELGVDPKNIFSLYQQLDPVMDMQQWPHLAQINVWLSKTPVFDYISTMRAYMLSKLSDQLPDKPVIYIDSDVYPISLPQVDLKDNEAHLSHSGHISINVMFRKTTGILERMCQAAGLDYGTALGRSFFTGGAQYLFPSEVFTNDFWAEAGFVMTEIHKILTEEYARDPSIRPWTADMWALQLLLWKRGVTTRRDTDQMSVCHAPDSADMWHKSKWYHNSYLRTENKRTVQYLHQEEEKGRVILFDKNEYTEKSPLGQDLSYVAEGTCSRIYADILSSTDA